MNKTEKSFSLVKQNSKADDGCYEGRRLEAWGDGRTTEEWLRKSAITEGHGWEEEAV